MPRSASRLSPVQALAPPVLRHRLQANYLSESDGVSVDDVISDLTRRVPEPGTSGFDDGKETDLSSPQENAAA